MKLPSAITILLVGLITIIVLFILIHSVSTRKEEMEQCAAQGGHKMTLAYDTLCVTPDGRIIQLN